MNGICKTLKRSIYDLKEFAKVEAIAKINKVVVEMANNLSLGVDEDGIEEPLETVPEELTNEELLELEQECISKEEARKKEIARERN